MTIIFLKLPIVAFKQPPNLKKMLCHAKIPQNFASKTQLTGMKKCHHDVCPTCPYILLPSTGTAARASYERVKVPSGNRPQLVRD